MTETLAAYLAGLIDGDGYFCITRRSGEAARKGEYSGVIRVVGVAEDAFARIASITTACLNKRSNPGPRRRAVYTLQWTQGRAFLLAAQIAPFLILKRDQCDVMLRFSATYAGRYHNGRPVPPEIRHERAALREAMHAANAVYGKSARIRHFPEEPKS